MWFETSFLLDQKQTKNGKSLERFENFAYQPLQYSFPSHFTGKLEQIASSQTLRNDRPKAAIIREKGSNSEREMANAMYLAGFDVKDVRMTDLISEEKPWKTFSLLVPLVNFKFRCFGFG